MKRGRDKEESISESRYFDDILERLAEGEEGIPKRYKSARAEIRAELIREIRGPGEIVKGLKLPAQLSREECILLMTAYKTGKKAFRNNFISRLLYVTGMRIEELENLKFCDVNYDTSTVFIRAGKGEKDRYTCLDEETLNMLKEWQKGKKLADSVIGLSLRQLRRIVEGAGEITGISQKYEAMGRYFSPHCLRHAFATHCYENGMRMLTLKKLLGHEYLGTTEIYLYTAMSYDVEEYERTKPLKKG